MRDNGVNAGFLEPSAVFPVLPMVVIGISVRDAPQAGSHSTRKNHGATGPWNLWLSYRPRLLTGFFSLCALMIRQRGGATQ